MSESTVKMQVQPESGGFVTGEVSSNCPTANSQTDPTTTKTYSVFYGHGFGFWVLRGDATNPRQSEAWHPLSFDHDQWDFSSYVTNAGTMKTLRCQRDDQQWPNMLLPTINQVQSVATSKSYGGLKGDLAIFIALLACSMRREDVVKYIPSLLTDSKWNTHSLPHGRTHQHGIVVYIYTCPPSWGNSSADVLRGYEEGVYGKYYQ
ncbi:hypothetical protein BU23DRAFT_219151 [Bimuria novae-zelandiae CBS 107.79]|uniref:Uncharacterized protein n=1 Tax=Bimuria novae-zelandiae CBS 107.79 TaxID=1447943 RepID=A0A6A5UZ20_9PLEO|nr:hypothetical protein BU23DRAFT_219151 [Bimuria novae-zelandiae CBS 107.79]